VNYADNPLRAMIFNVSGLTMGDCLFMVVA